MDVSVKQAAAVMRWNDAMRSMAPSATKAAAAMRRMGRALSEPSLDHLRLNPRPSSAEAAE